MPFLELMDASSPVRCNHLGINELLCEETPHTSHFLDFDWKKEGGFVFWRVFNLGDGLSYMKDIVKLLAKLSFHLCYGK